MTRPRSARTAIPQTGHARATEVRLDLAKELRDARRDAGLSVRQLARAAAVGGTTIAEIESADRDPGVEVLARIAAALGGRLRLWIEPGTGVAIHDRHQGAMIGALVRILDRRWVPTLEVAVYQPVRGVIDAVLDDVTARTTVAVEAESGLRRIEQQIRWARAKADSLATEGLRSGADWSVSRLLLLRSTATNRSVVATYADVLAAGYPARASEALEALSGSRVWPGPAIVWCETGQNGAKIRETPPRGIQLGR